MDRMAENKTKITWAEIAAGGQQPQGPAGGEKQEGTGQHSTWFDPVK
jgi:hypothetical protein